MNIVSIGPDPKERHPVEGSENVQFIKAIVTRLNIIAGDYSYYDAGEGGTFEERVIRGRGTAGSPSRRPGW
jgi:virginiamycin A acetyltransferase